MDLRILAESALSGSGISETLKENLPNTDGVTTGNLANILYWVYAIAGIAAVAVIIYGGVKYLTSQGDPAKTKQGSQIIAYAVVGLLVVALAAAITAFASGIIGGSVGGTD